MLFRNENAIEIKNTKKKIKLKKNIIPLLFLLPGIIVFALFKYYPMFLGFGITFFQYDIMKPPGIFVGLQNYINAIKDPNLINALINNFEFFIVDLLMAFWVPIALAIMVNEVKRGKTLFRTIYFIPAIAPGLTISFIFKYVWQPDMGFANYLLSLIHIPPQMWLNDVRLNKWCLFFPNLIMGGGMSFVIYLSALQNIANELFESSLIDGAGFFQRIRYIIIPQISPIIGIMFILELINAANLFDLPYGMTGGGPIGSTTTMMIYAYKTGFRDLQYSYGNTLSMVTFFIAFIITAIQMKVSSRQEE